MANTNAKTWCPKCKRYHYNGSRAYYECFVQPRHQLRGSYAKNTALSAKNNESYAQITPANAPAEDEYGNSYEFGSNNKVTLTDSTTVDSHYYVDNEDMTISESTVRDSLLHEGLTIANSDINGGQWKSSIVTDTDSTGHVRVSRSDIGDSTINHYGKIGSNFTILDSSLRHAALNGNRMVIRGTYLHHDQDEGDGATAVVHNSTPNMMAISNCIISSPAHSKPFTLIASGTADTAVRSSSIDDGVNINVGGVKTKLLIDNSVLRNVTIMATEDTTIERSYISPEVPITLPVAANGQQLTIRGALISQPTHITEWRDGNTVYGWMYRSIPNTNLQPGDSATVTFMTASGNTQTYDEADLFLYSTMDYPEGSADNIISNAVLNYDMTALLAPVTQHESEAAAPCLAVQPSVPPATW